jgi:hypothetical protein
VKANRAYDLIVTRGGAFDHIEIVEIASLEVVLFWDLLPTQTGRMSRALKTDLAQLDAEEFLDKWTRYE